MSDNQVCDVLAQAFAAEDVDTLFTLMGDANMYWSASMADNQKVRLIDARHEHCCVAMADAYARASGKVGVGSVTCGPGYTQIMTALAMAARGNAPVVVFAGDAPIGASWYKQSIDQVPLALGSAAGVNPSRQGLGRPRCVLAGFLRDRLDCAERRVAWRNGARDPRPGYAQPRPDVGCLGLPEWQGGAHRHSATWVLQEAANRP